jgi:hypothetical protein
MSNRYMHFFCPPGANSRYSLIVVDPKKKPFLPLTDFYLRTFKTESRLVAAP